MADYTICPKFIEYARVNKNFIYDVLMVFVPDNSKKICIDYDEVILKEYNKIIENDKDLLDWYDFLSKRKELNFVKVNLDRSSTELSLDICKNSFDKILISNCKSDYSSHYEFIKNSGIEILDKTLAQVHLNYFPTIVKQNIEVTEENVFDIVFNICTDFKDLIENKGMYKLLINKNRVRIPEKSAQALFYAVAYSYCVANNLKLSPEVDSGNGPVDFNLSRGFKSNVNVEMKIADNNKLESGLWSQLNIYNRAENSTRSIYLIIKSDNLYDQRIEKLLTVLNYRKLRGEQLPEIVVIDSSFRKSASVREE